MASCCAVSSRRGGRRNSRVRVWAAVARSRWWRRMATGSESVCVGSVRPRRLSYVGPNVCAIDSFGRGLCGAGCGVRTAAWVGRLLQRACRCAVAYICGACVWCVEFGYVGPSLVNRVCHARVPACLCWAESLSRARRITVPSGSSVVGSVVKRAG